MTKYEQKRILQAVELALDNCQNPMTLYVRDFCRRMYSAPQATYVERLNMLGLTDKERVLDAGCGFGQWSLALLAAGNAHVDACDVALERVEMFQSILRQLDEPRVNVVRCGLEELAYEAECFDAVFCYGAIHCADVPAALAEIYRVLRPGGIIYATANGLGFYVQRWIEAAPRVEGHSPRITMAQALLNTALVGSGAAKAYPVGIAIEQDDMHNLLLGAGFVNTTFAPDGHIDVSGLGRTLPFFPGEFKGMAAVYECMARKPMDTVKDRLRTCEESA